MPLGCASLTGGHPVASKVAVYDIITPDLKSGPIAGAAEAIAILNNFLDMFGDLSQHYMVVISHSKSECIGPDVLSC